MGKLTVGFGIVLVALCLCSSGCKKDRKTAPPDPHSPEAVLLILAQEGKLLNDAVGRNDLEYVHDHTYSFSSMARALAAKLNGQQKEHLRSKFEELASLTEQLDLASGRRHLEATQASLKELLRVLNELDKQFREMKQTEKIS